MRIGPLRHRVKIQTPVITRDDCGGAIETWEDFAAPASGVYTDPAIAGAETDSGTTGVLTTLTSTFYASIEPLIGREYMAAKQMQADVTHKIRMRYIPGLTTTMRIVFGTRVFEIESILNVQERNRELVIMATEDV